MLFRSGTALFYKILASAYPSGAPIANGTILPADASPAGRMTITVNAYDAYDNPRAGEAAAVLSAVPVGSSLFPGLLMNSFRTNTGANGGILMNVGSGTDSVSDVYYGVGQEVTFTLTGSAGTITQTPDLTFLATIHTVDHYRLDLSSYSFLAGANVTATVKAQIGRAHV